MEIPSRLSLDQSSSSGSGRTKLPAKRPPFEGLSIWALSKSSMPVTLNEPLSMLQRLCEELEYSELLDKASELSDPYERMVYVAAFAVSSYGSSYFRTGSKPFNPLLGETYECIREDKGFRFVAEQVSHHPPISVCFAESRNFLFWEEAQVKTKFWGKSLEFQPAGYTYVKLPRPATGGGPSMYHYNKVTSCVYNLFGSDRWVDHYGELKIFSDNAFCKLTFVKASYSPNKRHEVNGVVMDKDGGTVVRQLFGKWNEALYCGEGASAKCVWRIGTMPEDYELYYGFTRFAMELNELNPEMAKYLPNSDTRFRPDQRLLEEGNLNGAETTKAHLEQKQRDRRKRNEQRGLPHEPRWFKRVVDVNGSEMWEYNSKYWELRKTPGFASLNIEPLW